MYSSFRKTSCLIEYCSMSKISKFCNNKSCIFSEGIIFTNCVCLVQHNLSYITSRFLYDRFYCISYIFCILIFLRQNASNPHTKYSLILFVFFLCLEQISVCCLGFLTCCQRIHTVDGHLQFSLISFQIFLCFISFPCSFFKFYGDSSGIIFLTSSITMSSNSLNSVSC